jgi:hypothetical protein
LLPRIKMIAAASRSHQSSIINLQSSIPALPGWG